MATDVNQISVTVVNPKTRDFETHRFASIDEAVAWLTKRKNTKTIEVKDGE